MNKNRSIHLLLAALLVAVFFLPGCNKIDLPSASAVASLNVVNALPTSNSLILVQGPISAAIGQFSNIGPLPYGSIAVLTPKKGSEMLYALQSDIDTASVSGQGGEYMFDSVLKTQPALTIYLYRMRLLSEQTALQAYGLLIYRLAQIQ